MKVNSIFCFAIISVFLFSSVMASDWELIGKKKIQKLRPAIFDVESETPIYSRIKLVNEAGSFLEVIKLVIQYKDGDEFVLDIQTTLVKEQNPFVELILPVNDRTVDKVTISCRSKNRSLLAVYGIKD